MKNNGIKITFSVVDNEYESARRIADRMIAYTKDLLSVTLINEGKLAEDAPKALVTDPISFTGFFNPVTSANYAEVQQPKKKDKPVAFSVRASADKATNRLLKIQPRNSSERALESITECIDSLFSGMHNYSTVEEPVQGTDEMKKWRQSHVGQEVEMNAMTLCLARLLLDDQKAVAYKSICNFRKQLLKKTCVLNDSEFNELKRVTLKLSKIAAVEAVLDYYQEPDSEKWLVTEELTNALSTVGNPLRFLETMAEEDNLLKAASRASITGTEDKPYLSPVDVRDIIQDRYAKASGKEDPSTATARYADMIHKHIRRGVTTVPPSIPVELLDRYADIIAKHVPMTTPDMTDSGEYLLNILADLRDDKIKSVSDKFKQLGYVQGTLAGMGLIGLDIATPR